MSADKRVNVFLMVMPIQFLRFHKAALAGIKKVMAGVIFMRKAENDKFKMYW